MGLKLGPIVGEVTHSSAKIWFRTDAEGRHTCHVFTDSTPPTEVPGSPWEVVISRQAGHAATVQVALPDADQVYYYDIRGPGGSTILPGGRLAFKNAPAPGTSAGFTLAFVSCHKPFEYDEAQRFLMWDQMSAVFPAKNVRFLLMIGDQVYADRAYEKASQGEPAVEAYRDVYQEYWKHESVMKILGRYPTYMIWDDHEIRDGWGSGEDDHKMAPQKIFTVARQVYREFQHSHNPMSFGPEAQHYAFEFGQAGFLVLDLRGHRNLSRSTDERPLLGTKQWDDITEWLTKKAQNYRVLFIVCSVPMIYIPLTAADDLGRFFGSPRDHWSYEKNRPEWRDLVGLLFDVLNKRVEENGNPQKIIILGGNVHEGTVAEIQSYSPRHKGRRDVIYQFTSSPIANRPVSWQRLYGLYGSNIEFGDTFEYTGTVRGRFPERNLGLVHVNYDSNKTKVDFELHREGEDPLHFSTDEKRTDPRPNEDLLPPWRWGGPG
ncbi:MAG: phosphodiesterase/alkaline phosphatase D [candidate division NC10 bacterium CSP1-5]|nr:MAG: phosphodiesterase/alkaline phosphatase D [candidate division NC10 bacterium CSP1-5]